MGSPWHIVWMSRPPSLSGRRSGSCRSYTAPWLATSSTPYRGANTFARLARSTTLCSTPSNFSRPARRRSTSTSPCSAGSRYTSSSWARRFFLSSRSSALPRAKIRKLGSRETAVELAPAPPRVHRDVPSFHHTLITRSSRLHHTLITPSSHRRGLSLTYALTLTALAKYLVNYATRAPAALDPTTVTSVTSVTAVTASVNYAKRAPAAFDLTTSGSCMAQPCRRAPDVVATQFPKVTKSRTN